MMIRYTSKRKAAGAVSLDGKGKVWDRKVKLDVTNERVVLKITRLRESHSKQGQIMREHKEN